MSTYADCVLWTGSVGKNPLTSLHALHLFCVWCHVAAAALMFCCNLCQIAQRSRRALAWVQRMNLGIECDTQRSSDPFATR